MLSMLGRAPSANDETITVGEMRFVDPAHLRSAARDLVRRLLLDGAELTASDRTVLGAAWRHFLDQPVHTGWDVLVLEVCAKHRPWRSFTPRATDPTPVDARIEETQGEFRLADAQEFEARARLQAANDAVTADMIRRQAVEPSPPLVSKREEAREAYRIADDRRLRVRARLTALELARSRWRAENA